jgi:hypothetical protein
MGTIQVAAIQMRARVGDVAGNLSHTEIAGRVAALFGRYPVRDSALVGDATAVGKSVFDLFRADVPAHLSSISPRTRQAHPLGRPILRAEVLQKMDALFTEVDPWTTAAALAVSMLLGWGLGWWRGRRRPQGQREAPASKFHDSILALLGLLLAFTFSMSLAKHDQRRLMVVTDSNSIGDFYTSASLVKEPLRGKLQGAIREYVEFRLTLVKDRFTEADLQKARSCKIGCRSWSGRRWTGGRRSWCRWSTR